MTQKNDKKTQKVNVSCIVWWNYDEVRQKFDRFANNQSKSKVFLQYDRQSSWIEAQNMTKNKFKIFWFSAYFYVLCERRKIYQKIWAKIKNQNQPVKKIIWVFWNNCSISDPFEASTRDSIFIFTIGMVLNSWSKKLTNCHTAQSCLCMILGNSFTFGDFFHLWALALQRIDLFSTKKNTMGPFKPINHFVRYEFCLHHHWLHKIFVLLLLWLVVSPQL